MEEAEAPPPKTEEASEVEIESEINDHKSDKEEQKSIVRTDAENIKTEQPALVDHKEMDDWMQAGTTGRNIENPNTERPLIQFTSNENDHGKTKASVASIDEIDEDNLSEQLK